MISQPVNKMNVKISDSLIRQVDLGLYIVRKVEIFKNYYVNQFSKTNVDLTYYAKSTLAPETNVADHLGQLTTTNNISTLQSMPNFGIC